MDVDKVSGAARGGGCRGVFKGVQSSRLGAEGAPSGAARSAGESGAICCAGVSTCERGDASMQRVATAQKPGCRGA